MVAPREVDLTFDDFADPRLLLRAEGSAVYLGERQGRFYIIVNQSAVLDLLSEEDQQGLSPLTVREFDTEAQRTEYLRRRHWLPGQGPFTAE